MTEPEFWKLIASTRKADPEEHVERLIAKLAKRPVDEIVAFGFLWFTVHRRAYTFGLWGAAYLMNGGCSDDGFMDFRTWLMLQGEKTFAAALANPDSLAQVRVGMEEADCECYPAPTAYELATGTKNPDDYYKALDAHGDRPPPGEPAGEDWDFDDDAEMAKRLPKLFAKFGGG